MDLDDWSNVSEADTQAALLDSTQIYQPPVFDFSISESAALKRRHNAVVPISRLPVEILQDIFQLCVAVVERSPHGSNYNYEAILSVGHQSWAREITHVCSHWRDVACNMPSLWRHILVSDGNLHRIQTFVARAKAIPLIIEVNASGHAEETLRFLSGYVASALSLILHISSVDFSILSSHIRSPTLAAQKLLLTGYFWTPGQKKHLTLFKKWSAPFMKELYLCGFRVIDWGSLALPRSLRKLVVIDEFKPISSMPTIIEVLLRLPLLEMLHIREVNPPQVQPGSDPFANATIACFPRLKILYFCSSSERCAQIMTLCSFLPSTIIDLQYMPTETMQPLASSLSPILQALDPRMLQVNQDRPAVGFSVEGIPPSAGFLDLLSPSTPNIEFGLWECVMRQLYRSPIEQVFPLLPLGNITTLHITDSRDRNRFPDLAAWGSSVESMPNLEVLCLASHQVPEGNGLQFEWYYDFMVSLLGCDFEEVNNNFNGSVNILVLVHPNRMPKLQCIRFHGFLFPLQRTTGDGDYLIMDEFAGMLRGRTNPLKTVVLQQCGNVDDEDVLILRKAVDVKWDGITFSTTTF